MHAMLFAHSFSNLAGQVSSPATFGDVGFFHDTADWQYWKTRKFHLRLIFAISAGEANPWKLKASKNVTLII